MVFTSFPVIIHTSGVKYVSLGVTFSGDSISSLGIAFESIMKDLGRDVADFVDVTIL